jgi:hypothetical protein
VSIPPPEPLPSLPPYQAASSPAQYYASPPQKSKTLGVVAFVAGLTVLVASPIVSVFVGLSLGHLVQPGAGFAQGFSAGANSRDPQSVIGGLLIFVQLLLGTGLGIWALVQGIVAVRLGRGRSWGVVAIVFAAVAPILSFVVYIVVGVAQSAR